MQRLLQTSFIAAALLLASTLSHAETISLDEYNHYQEGPFFPPFDQYVYKGYAFDFGDMGVGKIDAGYYFGYHIGFNSVGNTPFMFNGADIATQAASLGAVDEVIVQGYRNNVLVGQTIWNLPADSTYRNYTTSFSGQVDRIDLSGTTDAGFFGKYSLNAFNVTPVPEPETYALFGLGLVSLLALRKRQQR